MGINIASSFTRNAPVPIDDISVVADLTARDAIPAGVRYEGMPVFVISEGANYQLVGGILNANWEDFGSGGGGGSSMNWSTVDGRSGPSTSQDDFLDFWDFSDSLIMYIKTSFTVPSSYVPGDQIKLKNGIVRVNSTDTTKDILIRASSYLFLPSNSLESTNGNLHVSTNTEVAVLANALYGISLGDIDVTTAIGEMDSVAVVPGAKIVTLMYRDLANETAGVPATVQLLKDSMELSIKD